jgi:hypothetical protein
MVRENGASSLRERGPEYRVSFRSINGGAQRNFRQ